MQFANPAATQKILAFVAGATAMIAYVQLDNSSVSSSPPIGLTPMIDGGVGSSCSLYMMNNSSLYLRGGEVLSNFVISNSTIVRAGASYNAPLYVGSPNCARAVFSGHQLESPVGGSMSGTFLGCSFYGSGPAPKPDYGIKLTSAGRVNVDACRPTLAGGFGIGLFGRTVPTAIFCTLDYSLVQVSVNTVIDETGNNVTLLMDASGGARTATLPAPALFLNRIVTVKKTDATVNTVTVLPGAGTIDGLASVVLTNQYGSIQVISDGVNWNVLYQFSGSPSSGLFSNIQSVAADTVLDATYATVLVSAAGAARTITLPNANTCKGRMYIVKKTDATANVVTLASGGGTIDGAATASIVQQNAALTVQSDGTNWYII